jgi:uncharacterized membrane protein YfcA
VAVVGVVTGAWIAHAVRAEALRRVVAWALLFTALLIAAQMTLPGPYLDFLHSVSLPESA